MMDPNNKNLLEFAMFGEVIHSYTRAQAIADGVLIDATVGELAEVTQQHFQVPIAMTAAVHALIQEACDDPAHFNDRLGVWHDILWMARVAIQRRETHSPGLLFPVIITPHGEIKLKMHSGPGDEGEHVLTLMLPHED